MNTLLIIGILFLLLLIYIAYQTWKEAQLEETIEKITFHPNLTSSEKSNVIDRFIREIPSHAKVDDMQLRINGRYQDYVHPDKDQLIHADHVIIYYTQKKA